MTWIEAQLSCNQIDTYLVEIFDQNQQNLINLITESKASEFGNCSPWIGLTTLAQKPYDWVWAHSLEYTNTNTSYTSWLNGHPYNDNEYNFALMGWGDNYNWIDINREYTSCSICQLDIDFDNTELYMSNEYTPKVVKL